MNTLSPKTPQSLFGERTVDQFPRTAGIWAGLMKETNTLTLPSGVLVPITHIRHDIDRAMKAYWTAWRWQIVRVVAHACGQQGRLVSLKEDCFLRSMPASRLICFDCSCVIKYWLEKKINSFVCGLILKMITMNNDIGLGLYCAFLPQS